MVIVLFTNGPLSGIETSVPLVPEQVGGGGGEPPATNSSRFGEPAPGFTMTPGVASATSRSRTCCGVKVGFADRTSAAAPAVCGVAMEVPLSTAVAVSDVIHADVMFTPGANRSRQVPKLENDARTSVMSDAPSVIAVGTRAGEKLHASA